MVAGFEGNVERPPSGTLGRLLKCMYFSMRTAGFSMIALSYYQLPVDHYSAHNRIW